MNLLIQVLRYFHRFILIIALILTAITPIIFKDHTYTFLYLPVLLVIIGILSMNIDHWLNKYEISVIRHNKLKFIKKCLIKQDRCCFHH